MALALPRRHAYDWPRIMSVAPPTGADAGDDVLYRRHRESRDEDALAALVARHWPRVFRLAWRVVRDPALAEDVAQQTLVKAFGRGGFRGDGALGGWLARIVVNEAKNAATSRRRRERHEEQAAAARSAGGPGGPEDPELLELIRAHLEALSEDLRVPLVLHYEEGLSHAEVADALGMAKGTAASRLRRGVERLRESLGARLAAGLAFDRVEAAIRASASLRAPPVPAAPGAAALALRIARAGSRALAAKAAAVGLASVLAGALLVVALRPVAPRPGETTNLVATDAGSRGTRPEATSPGDATSRGVESADPAPPPQQQVPAGPAVPSPDPAPPAPSPDAREGASSPPPSGRKVHLLGQVRDATTLAPIAGAEIAISSRSRLEPGKGAREDVPSESSWGCRTGIDATTDGNGCFGLDIEPMWSLEDEGVEVQPQVTEIVVVIRAEGHAAFVRRIPKADFQRRLEVLLESGAGYAVRGRVVEKGSGAPVPDAKLEVRVSVDGRPSGRLEGEDAPPAGRIDWGDSHAATAADREGRFEVSGLPQGAAVIEIARQQGLGRVSRRVRASVEPEETVIEIERAARLTVTVASAAGEPVTSALVSVDHPDGSSLGPVLLADLEGGALPLGSLAPGTYRLRALILAPGEAEGPEERGRIRAAPDCVEDVVLAAGDDRRVTLRPGAKPAGEAKPAPAVDAAGSRVTCTVRFESGGPAAGIPVWIASAGLDDWHETIEATTDDSGRAEFARVPPGRWKAQASASAVAAVLARFEVGGADATVDLVIPDRFPVRGIVRDARGAPVAGADVRASEAEGGKADREGKTGADGAFALGPLTRGKLFVSVAAEGHAHFLSVVEHDGREIPIDLKEGRTVTIRGAIASDAAALEGAEVHAWLALSDGSGHGGPTPRIADGAFEIEIEGVAAVAGTLTIRMEGHLPTTRPVAPDTSEIVIDDLCREKGYSVRGRVDEAAAKAVAGGAFSFVAAEGTGFAQVHDGQVKRDGSFEITGLPAGTAKIHVSVATGAVGARTWLEADVEVDPATVRDGDLGVVTLRPRSDEEK